ncbi:hypothetical protein [Agaribacterium sp. ZY112]|uniref:hypothetical protein n=1 Tax=Agaribacterium sp. ZY112 TaxID=3233574 RepID=UPI0035231754
MYLDIYLTIAAVLVEFGLPLALIYISIKIPTKRYLTLPVLGSVLPFVLFMLISVIGDFLIPSNEPSMVSAGFVMGFFFYAVLVILGALIGLFVPRNLGALWRFLLALLIAPVIGLVVVATI